MGAALGRPADLRRDLARVLTAVGFGALVLLAEAPLLLLAPTIELGYHQTTLLMVGCFAVGGGAAVVVLAGAVRRNGARDSLAVLLVLLTTLVLVGAQMSWTLRPYLVRPRTADAPFVRALEGSLFDAVLQTYRSAQGRYDRAELDRE